MDLEKTIVSACASHTPPGYAMKKVGLIASVLLAGPLVRTAALAAQEPDVARTTIAVLPFSVQGYVRDSSAITQSAAVFESELRQLLGRDSSLLVLPAALSGRPIERDATRPPALHHIVTGTVSHEDREHVIVRWMLIAVGSRHILI